MTMRDKQIYYTNIAIFFTITSVVYFVQITCHHSIILLFSPAHGDAKGFIF
jgi:hypothetical protein